MMDPKTGTVEYVSSSGHQVDDAGNIFLRDGVFLTKATEFSLRRIKDGRWAGMDGPQ